MQFVFKPYSKLTVDELYEVLKLRSAIFVVEQNCVYQDIDDKDKKAWHVLGYEGEQLKAYARIIPAGISYKEASIGRVVVAGDYRGKNAGKELMKEAIKNTFEAFKTNEIVISAQHYLLKFYNDLGFKEEGNIYPEDDIPHIKMRLKK